MSLTIAGAWLVMVIARVSGNAAALHHHALIEGDTPPGLAILAFLVAWQLMVVAMMWPASLSAVRDLWGRWSGPPRPRLGVTTFLAASVIIWAGFGIAAFVGDLALHSVVDATPWLAARPWLIEAGVLAAAGAYQFTPLKRRYLAVCRSPREVARPSLGRGPIAFRLGLRHGFDCLGSSWALMLLMFATGFAGLWSMAALTLLMVYETTGRHGRGAATAAGLVLLLAALAVLSGPVAGLA